jgi:autotransporter-associated beta strand protein
MLSNWFYRWFRGRSLAKRGPSRTIRPRVRLELQHLENRLAPAIFTWRGGTGGTGTLWSDPNNWVEHQVPTATDPEKDDVLVFPATGVLSFNSQNNLGNVSTSQIRIAGSGYNISGGAIRLDTNAPAVPGLLFDGNNNTLSSNLELNDKLQDMVFQVTNFNFAALTGIISTGTPITGPSGFRKLGTGTLILAGAVNNIYTGNTTVEDGTLDIRQAGALGAVTAGTTVINP